MDSNKNQKFSLVNPTIGNIEESLVSEYLFQASFFLNLAAIILISEDKENSVEHLVLEQKYEEIKDLKIDMTFDYSKEQIIFGNINHNQLFNQSKYVLPKYNLSYLLIPIEGKSFYTSKKIMAIFKNDVTNYHELILEMGKLCEKLNNTSYDSNTKINLKLHLENLEKLLNKKFIESNIYANKLAQIEEENISNNHLLQLFLRNLFHDLVNPLSTLSMCVEFLEDQVVDESTSKMIERMGRSANLMAQIIKRNRDIQKLITASTPVPKENFTLKEIEYEVHKMFDEHLKAKNLQVEIASSNKSSDYIYVDRVGFSSFVLYNTFSNAIKYSQEGSKIVFGIKKEESKDFFFVKDFGIGIPENVMPTIFSGEKKQSRIGTNGEAGQGTGLLWMKYYLDKNSQELKVQSKETGAAESRETEFKIAI